MQDKIGELQLGKRKISEYLKSQQSTTASESQIRCYCTNFLYDCEEEQLYIRSTEVNTCHRRCVTREELTKLIQGEHGRDHHRAETLYESLRCSYYPVVRESMISLYNQHVVRDSCSWNAPLPKTTLTRRVILATYPNSRRQMDLKKLPACSGYEYVCHTIDCYSRIAMGAGIKNKSAKEVCRVIVSCMYRYGAPRILQTDNGKEFNNASLTEVMQDMKALKINGRHTTPKARVALRD